MSSDSAEVLATRTDRFARKIFTGSHVTDEQFLWLFGLLCNWRNYTQVRVLHFDILLLFTKKNVWELPYIVVVSGFCFRLRWYWPY